jgi:hypothetical protein
VTDFRPIAHIDAWDNYGTWQQVDVYAYDELVRVNIDAREDGIELAFTVADALRLSNALCEAVIHITNPKGTP